MKFYLFKLDKFARGGTFPQSRFDWIAHVPLILTAFSSVQPATEFVTLEVVILYVDEKFDCPKTMLVESITKIIAIVMAINGIIILVFNASDAKNFNSVPIFLGKDYP
jgi:hypothetical protein